MDEVFKFLADEIYIGWSGLAVCVDPSLVIATQTTCKQLVKQGMAKGKLAMPVTSCVRDLDRPLLSSLDTDQTRARMGCGYDRAW
jgi:hypothetical protein